MDEKRRIMKNKKLHKIIGILGIIFSVLLGVVGTLLAFSANGCSRHGRIFLWMIGVPSYCAARRNEYRYDQGLL